MIVNIISFCLHRSYIFSSRVLLISCIESAHSVQAWLSLFGKTNFQTPESIYYALDEGWIYSYDEKFYTGDIKVTDIGKFFLRMNS